MPLPIENKTRDARIDIARGLGMILVIYAHALEMALSGQSAISTTALQLWQFIYSFHMPMFFVISGMLFRPKSTKNTLISSLNLIYTSSIWHLVGWCFLLILFRPIATPNSLIIPILTQTHFSLIVIWFITALAMIQLIYHIIQNVSAFSRTAILIGTASVFYLAQTTGNTPFQIGAILPGLGFYALGHWLTKTQRLINVKHGHLLLSAIMLAVCLTLAPLNSGCLFNPLDRCPNKGDSFAVLMATGQLGFIPLFFLTAISGSFSVILLSGKLAELPGRSRALLCWIGQNTLDLLIANGFVFVFIEPRLQYFLSRQDFNYPLSTAIALTTLQIACLPLILPVTRKISVLSLRHAEIMIGSLPIKAKP